MSKLNTLRDGLLDELKDLYSAEHQLLKALPKMERKASSPALKKAIHGHLLETEGQVERLDEIATLMEEKLTGKTCKAMRGLIEEGSEVIEEESHNEALLDALLIGAARRVEHYEIAAYCNARAMAHELGEDAVAKLLAQTFDEEMKADQKLSSISEEEVLSQANVDSGMDDKNGGAKSATIQKSQNQKKSGNAARVLSFLGCLFLIHQVGSVALAETEQSRVTHEVEATNYKSDNTGRNVRDRNDARATADEQKMGGSELEVLAGIRREIVANEELSTNAHNVKIVVENGKVILRGPVKSAQEKAWIQEATARMASGYKVVNQLEVTPG